MYWSVFRIRDPSRQLPGVMISQPQGRGNGEGFGSIVVGMLVVGIREVWRLQVGDLEIGEVWYLVVSVSCLVPEEKSENWLAGFKRLAVGRRISMICI